MHIKRPTDDTPNLVKIGPLVLEKKIIANNDECQPTAIGHLSHTGDLTNIRMVAMQFSAFHHLHVCKENQIIITSRSRCLFVFLFVLFLGFFSFDFGSGGGGGGGLAGMHC